MALRVLTGNVSAMIYRQYPTTAEIDRQLTMGMVGPNRDASYAAFRDGAYAAREAFRNRLDVCYGPGDRQRFDLFYATRNAETAPTVIFFHGGMWRLSDKFFANFYANALCSEGFNVIAATYGFWPLLDLGQIIDQARACVAYVSQEADSLGLSADRLVVSGNSAGAHLACCCLQHDWKADGVEPGTIRGGFLFSGLYDLYVVYYSGVYQMFNWTEPQTRAWSPQYAIRAGLPPIFALYGEQESDEFKRQTIDLVAGWKASGNVAEVTTNEGDHYSSQLIATDPGTQSNAALLQFLRRVTA